MKANLIEFDYLGQNIIILRAVELSISVELMQRSLVQWKIQRETIQMTPEQTVQLMNLLKNKRKASGLSVAEVGSRAGVEGSTVWRIEEGMITSPKAESLQAIGEVLNIPSTDLFAIVGWIPTEELPSFGPYLFAKYPQLPDEAVHELVAVASKYGVSVEGKASSSTDENESPQKEGSQ